MRLANHSLAFPGRPGFKQAPCAQHVTVDLALENPRQLTSQFSGHVAIPVVVGGMDFFPRIGIALGPFRYYCDRISRLSSRNYQSSHTSARNSMDQPLLERLGRYPNQHSAGCFVDRAAAASSLPDGRRDRSHNLSQADLEAKTA